MAVTNPSGLLSIPSPASDQCEDTPNDEQDQDEPNGVDLEQPLTERDDHLR